MPDSELNVHQIREIDRMNEQLTKTTRPMSPALRRLFNVLLVAMVLLFIVIAIVRVSAETDHWICDSAAEYAFSPGALWAEWDGKTWHVLDANEPANPQDDVWHLWTGDESVYELGILYAHSDRSENGPAYIDYYDTDTGLLWRFAFKDLIATTEGGRYGHHHSCPQGPVAFKLESDS